MGVNGNREITYWTSVTNKIMPTKVIVEDYIEYTQKKKGDGFEHIIRGNDRIDIKSIERINGRKI